MTALPEEKWMTWLDCNQMELDTGFKYEWLDGHIVARNGDEAMDAAIKWMNLHGFSTPVGAMAGATPLHNTLSANLMRILGTHLRGKPCQVWSSDLKVRVSEANRNYFPDVVVACPPHQWDELDHNALLNPTILVEILSPSTQAYDQNEKWENYRRLSSLQEYILVSSDRVHIQQFVRQTENDGRDWMLHFVESLDETLHLGSIDGELSLTEIYERIDFTQTPDE